VRVITAVQGPDHQRVQSSPPDAQVAVGPTAVLQATNHTVTVYSHSGQILRTTTPQAFFGIDTTSELFDPQLFYDAHTGRFFAAEDTLIPSELYVAASKSANPLQGWTVTHVPFNSKSCPDQPHLGISNTAIAVGVFLFPGGCSGDITGNPKADLVIVDKQALMSGQTDVAWDRFSASYSQSDFPLKDIGSNKNLYVVHFQDPNKPSTVVYMSVYRGTPNTGTFFKDLTFSVPTIASPPDSADVEPGQLQLDLNDDRPRSGFVIGNTAYLALHDQCTPKGDTAARSCVRVLAFDLATQQLIGDRTLAHRGQSLEYPAIAPDRHGNVWLVAEYFSPRLDPGVLAVVYTPRLAQASAPVLVQRGHAPLALENSGDTIVRMGDYSGASEDAADPGTVWVTSEYGKSSGNWGTVVAHLGMG
jgi:hypothetical protein